jgi:plastocyanin
MKKLYSLFFACSLMLLSFTASAVNVPIGVGTNGSGLANQFFPASVNAQVGDVLQFILAGGTHNVTGMSLPGGAATMASGNMSTPGQQYNYTVTVAGTYTFQCTLHSGMTGTANVSAVGINDPAGMSAITNVYPSPFQDKVTVKYNGIEKIEFVNMLGEQVKNLEITTQEGKLDVYFDNLPAGVYFYRTYKEGMVVETRKIVKAK